METVTYQLDTVQTGKSFYNELSVFTTQLLDARNEKSLADVDNFIYYIKSKMPSKVKTFDEHYLEYLTMGTLLNKYSVRAMSSGVISLSILKSLYKNRNRIPAIKPLVDKLRGVLSTLLLNNSFRSVKVDSASRFIHFLRWIEATGEFSEETIRLKAWHKYLKGLTYQEQSSIFENAVLIANEFEIQAKKKLGTFTQNVDVFRKNQLPIHRFKENYLFCGRYEVEYHLNMVGAEILNRALKSGFDTTSKKVILLPTCMAKPKDGKCKARVRDSKLTCTACSPNCNINLKRIEYASQSIEVVLIPHSSEFTKYLKYWKDQDTTGLVGVACVLNLLKGGYEMQKLNIPSQCVFLDYCGCKKHWHKQGIPTNLDGKRLKEILSN